MKKLRLLLRKYKSYINFLYLNHTEKHDKFIEWLNKYVTYKRNEQTFNSTFLPRYERGQIIFIDLGCGINREFSYPHYAIVLNVQDKKKNDLLTIVPVTSKKPKHSKLKPWEHEIIYPFQNLLIDKVLNSFNIYAKEYKHILDKIITLGETGTSITKDEFDEQYIKILNEGITEIYNNNTDIMKFVNKMKQGSIVEVNQIRTISKARIMFPRNKKHALFGVKVHDADLEIIKYKVMNHILEDVSNIDNNTFKNV